MPIIVNNVEVPESELLFLKMIYQNKYEDFKIRFNALLEEGESLKPMLRALGITWDISKSSSPIEFISDVERNRKKQIAAALDFHFNVMGGDNYSAEWSWLQKCKHILDIVNMPLTSNEIIDVMIEYFEPSLERIKAINSVPATLSVAATKDRKLERRQNENGEYEYYEFVL